MAILNGTVYLLSVGGTALPDQTEGSISINMETRDITTKDSAGWRELLAGTRSGSISCSGLIDYTDTDNNKDATDLFLAFENRTALSLTFEKANEVTGDLSFACTGFLTSLEQSGGTEDTATYSATFELSGEVTEATI